MIPLNDGSRFLFSFIIMLIILGIFLIGASVFYLYVSRHNLNSGYKVVGWFFYLKNKRKIGTDPTKKKLDMLEVMNILSPNPESSNQLNLDVSSRESINLEKKFYLKFPYFFDSRIRVYVDSFVLYYGWLVIDPSFKNLFYAQQVDQKSNEAEKTVQGVVPSRPYGPYILIKGPENFSFCYSTLSLESTLLSLIDLSYGFVSNSVRDSNRKSWYVKILASESLEQKLKMLLPIFDLISSRGSSSEVLMAENFVVLNLNSLRFSTEEEVDLFIHQLLKLLKNT